MLRPWPAADGALVRVRLIGGQVSPVALRALGDIAREYGDGDLHLTGRANVQLRGLPVEMPLTPFESAGLLPSRRHDLARNVMLSPASGLAGGRADLRPVAREIDRLLLASDRAADLPGRFLFVLDDGRGDLLDRPVDLGLVAVDAAHAQLRVGTRTWGDIVSLADGPRRLVAAAHRFLQVREPGADAAWHVDELTPTQLAELVALAGTHVGAGPDPRMPAPSDPPSYGVVAGGTHVAAPGGVVSPALLAELLDQAPVDRDLVVTPWRGVLVPS